MQILPQRPARGLLLLALAPWAAPVCAQDALVHFGSRAPGTVNVSRTGNVFSLRFSGDEVIEYRLDLDQPYVSKGRISIEETSSQCWPMRDVNPGYRDASGALHSVGWLSAYANLTGTSMTQDSVVLDFTDDFTPIGEGVRHRRTTLTLRGKMLSVRHQDLDQSTSYSSNYIGILHGDATGFDSPHVLRLLGGMTQPIVQFQNAAGRHYYYGSVLDLFNTNASNYFQNQIPYSPDATTTALNYGYSTWNQYAPLTNGTQIAAPVDDTFRILVSSRVEDAFVTPTQRPSPYRELLTNRLAIVLASSDMSGYPALWDMLDRWGVDNIAAYFFNWSGSPPDPPSTQTVGPDWWPPADPTGFTQAVQTALTKGFLIGAYNHYVTMPPTAPPGVLDTTHVAHAVNGQPKVMLLNGFPIVATTASGIHAVRESQLLRNQAGANLGYLDIQTYSSPSRGADGDHIDQLAGSPWAQTLKTACADQKAWMRSMQEIFEGPLLGEGSYVDAGSNHEFLWAGYCDGTQRSLNTGTGLSPRLLPADRRGWSLSVTGWPVVPDIDWYVFNRLQVNHGNGFYERFFSPSDGPAIMSGADTILPLTEAAFDRYRIYELSFGKSGFLITNGSASGAGNFQTHADLLREYFMTNALQSRYTRELPTEILYEREGVFRSFQPWLEQTGTLDTFRDPHLLIRFPSNLEMWLNHAGQTWVVSVGGVTYSIPNDGFVAVQPSTGLICFSAIPQGFAARFDYCLDPGAYEFFDGRGSVPGYGGQSTPSVRGVSFTSFTRGRTFQEQPDGSVALAGPTNAPALLRVQVEPATNGLATGMRKGLKAIAVYQNGARRDVTKLVHWSTLSSGVASVNDGAALTANGPGSTSVTVTPWNGAPVVPASVTVQ